MIEKATIQKIEEDLENLYKNLKKEHLIPLNTGETIYKEPINGYSQTITKKQTKIYVRNRNKIEDKTNYNIIVTASDEEMGARITIYNENNETINVSSKKIIDLIDKIDKKIHELK